MRVLIVEDELPAYNRLVKLLKEVLPEAVVESHLDSVADSVAWFQENEAPDVIFMDIHLADGSAFDLLKKVSIESPIIFTTAYDQYAIDAFNASSIAYLLKPIKADKLKSAIDKLDDFKKLFNSENAQQELILDALKPGNYKKRFLVRFGDNIKTVPTDDIAYFYSENKATFAKTTEDRTYPIDSNLDALEKVLDPDTFFRINRQYIVALKAIADMKAYSKARVLVKLLPATKDAPLVSSERSANFKKWLGDDL
ncbi:MAG: response regulator transcription factor [Chitinophagales bacterium]|nr:response regulator transcription factor [Chitinophagaceae bacterium]MCB9065109.1 response regulator transcription factor [Chitinophagales bacterium]